MNRLVATLLILVLGSFASLVLATEDKFHFESPEKTALFIELTKELRCPKCQNQNIADSDAMIAVDLKRKVYELLQKDYDKDQVIDFMKQRYGDFVYYQPPVNPMTIWLWLLPVLFILVALAGIVMTRKRQPSEINDEQLAKAQAILERDE
ncbi:cytochrome c-type biogenesis protein [Paraglaciecola sp. MB-3u-78]|jgi:cytochrome c-type biogenesis protein CcmH|uniref:cytochrome c-type biogenesis protein n=1 Tax=Paraglaciecola sp. MB-3u-78 TaxID=2058332 RepID=UPI000C34339E|nr:cytochrome c-type biogenesis protein [Paraglaciecola sp. MB-3u-78]PKG98895.1 cytochrome c-type biogenesis protein CcmH [Paraglaciecola sp. MB-3u-78]